MAFYGNPGSCICVTRNQIKSFLRLDQDDELNDIT